MNKEEEKLIVKAQIKEYLGEFSMSEGVPGKVGVRVCEILNAAMERAKENGRRTVMERDL